MSKVNNIPIAHIAMTSGRSHHKIYLIYAKQSTGIPLMALNDISGARDSKFNSKTGRRTIVILAKYLETTSLAEDIFLL